MFAKRLLYGITIFWSALLLFLVQPMMAKAVLPWFGGSAGVWTASMLFFQVVLLLGYAYAHAVASRLGARAQVALHLALLALSLLWLPVVPARAWQPTGGVHPIAGILGLLAVSLGLPYFLLSTTSPLVQSWYARAKVAFPYRLFVVSNLASIASLLGYPVAIEPFLSTHHQLLLWSAGYAGFVLVAGAAALASRAPGGLLPSVSRLPTLSERALWIGLAACASALWLAVANHLSQNVAPVPFLWVLPLGLYLATFVACFGRRCWYSPHLFRWILPAAWGAMLAGFLQPPSGTGLKTAVLLFLAGLTLCCLFCHGELARRKPAAAELTSFYLMLALGGAAGGVFVGLVAPTCFSTYLELPLALAACVLLALALVYQCSARHLASLGLLAILAILVSSQVNAWANGNRIQLRNFYGALRVADGGKPGAAIRVLANGSIQHGIQFLDPGRSNEATTYYGPGSGIALAIRRLEGLPQRIGVIGLGTGTLACYGAAGDYFRFYELNPQVIQLAYTQFRFLRDSPARIDVVPGDARLALEREPPQHFDLLALDAFNGDAIPVHLLTREAFALYFRHLKPDGILALHITNRYLDLAPAVQAVAGSLHAATLLVRSRPDAARYLYDTSWMLVAAGPRPLAGMRWAALPVTARRHVRPWTDDYSNLFQVLR